MVGGIQMSKTMGVIKLQNLPKEGWNTFDKPQAYNHVKNYLAIVGIRVPKDTKQLRIFFTVFYISHESCIKTFLKLSINECRKARLSRSGSYVGSWEVGGIIRSNLGL